VQVQLQIKPGLRQAWRGPRTVQIGLDARRGTLVDGLTGSDRQLLERLTTGIDEQAGADERARELVRLLRDAGVLVRSRAGRAALTRLGPGRHRLVADAQVWSVVHDGVGDGWELLAARAARTVEVIGAGRTGSSLAAMLAAAGVGRLRVRDGDPVRPQDVAPAGAGLADVGRPREEAVRQALDRLGYQPSGTPGTRPERIGRLGDGSHLTGRHQPHGTVPPTDLVVLVEHDVADAAAADPLLAADIPHLSVVIGEAGATVGPLVVPGRGPCLRCLELHRADRDPGWPPLLAQLLTERHGRGAEETACAGVTAGLACLQVLGQLDGVHTPAARAATLEVELPDGLVSRRDWPAHPACGCHWPPVRPPEPRHAAPTADRAGGSDHSAGTMPL
jgi:hypothetical protein